MIRYRIVRDNCHGYEVQFKRRWWPFWLQCGTDGNGGRGMNSHQTIEQAEKFSAAHFLRTQRRQLPYVVKTLTRFDLNKLKQQ
jgi:hypothetical protein